GEAAVLEVGLRRAIGIERGEQREVQSVTVRDGIGGGLLGERVEEVIERLERDRRPNHLGAAGTWSQQREGGRALEVAPLACQGLERETRETRVGNRQGAAP